MWERIPFCSSQDFLNIFVDLFSGLGFNEDNESYILLGGMNLGTSITSTPLCKQRT